MMAEILKSLIHFNTTALNWFILLADGTVKGLIILTAMILLVKFRNRLRPQTGYLMLFFAMSSLLLIPLLTRGIVIFNDRLYQVPERLNFSRDLNQLFQQPGPIFQIDPQITAGLNPGYQLPHWSVWFFLVWSMGIMIILGKILQEMVITYRLDRNAEIIDNPDRLLMLDQLRTELGIPAPVILKLSNQVPVPMVLGCFKPVILLPGCAGNWSAECLRVVLLHELAHIKRYDNLRLRLATLAAMVYWFNPLVWIALRLLKKNRELACDDRVLETGVLPSIYATHLLAIIGSLRSVPTNLKTTAAMASTHMEQRMVNILTKYHNPPHRAAKYKLFGLLFMALITMALCSIPNFIGLVTADEPDPVYIEKPQIQLRGDQLELMVQDKVLTGSVTEFPTLWPEQGVKHKINAPFGQRFHPILKRQEFHSGIDIGSPMGTPIVATADGEITAAEFRGGYGNYIEIKHKYLISTYSKLSKIMVHSGDSVRRGDIIGYSGRSGVATGPHLHYEIRAENTFLNPLALAGRVEQ